MAWYHLAKRFTCTTLVTNSILGGAVVPYVLVACIPVINRSLSCAAIFKGLGHQLVMWMKRAALQGHVRGLLATAVCFEVGGQAASGEICAFVQQCWPQLFVRGRRLSVGPWGWCIGTTIRREWSVSHWIWARWQAASWAVLCVVRWQLSTQNPSHAGGGRSSQLNITTRIIPSKIEDDITRVMSTQLFGREKGWGEVL